MNKYNRLLSLVGIVVLAFVLGSCSKTAENEHLPEYCRTYSGFMDVASADLYELIGGTNERSYLSDISQNQLTFVEYDETREMDLSGIQCFQNLTSLTLEGYGFKDISEISALKNIQQIALINTNVVSISSFKNLSKVNSLTISNTKTLQSVDGVEEMTKLIDLDLSDNGIVNISGLNNLVNLESLNLQNNEITFFPSINNLTKLESLDVSNNNIVQLGDDLSGLSNLKYFDANNNDICDLSTLDDLTSLIELDLSFNDLGCNGTSPDFSSLEGATNLTKLYLNDNDLTSISDLAGRALPLEELYLQNNQISNISPISGFTDLKVLEMFNNQISTINELTNMSGITRIDLSQNQITDFSNLRSIPDLELIDLSENQITFIPDISESWPSLRELDLSSNVITDTSGVEGHENLRTLRLNNNALTTLTGISNLPLLEELILYQEIPDEVPEDFVFDEFPNTIQFITNSYNNLPDLVVTDEGYLDLGYDLAPNAVITGSFNDMSTIEVVDLSGMDIDSIDAASFNLENLEGIFVADNNISDISFVLGNFALTHLDISGNPVENLTILNATTTEDLSNLEQVDASGITGVNNLDGAFVDLPDLTFLNLTNTHIETISNSFNGLDELVDFNITGDHIISIHNSFNDIFAVQNTQNDIIFTEASIYSITDSFNRGNYDSIIITDHTTFEIDTIISGSFNEINVANIAGIVISNSDFKTITTSFNDVVTDNLYLMNNKTETITSSFARSDIGVKLNLQNNELSVLDDLIFETTSIDQLDLANNALTSVSFIDGINGLTTLDISNQLTLLDAPTLSVIDGINNMPDLDDITFTGLGITDIDGFKDIGITEFSYSFDDNNGVFITTISETSFENSLVVNLDLEGHNFTNIDFLDNFTTLETLNISVDMADLSGFTTMPFELTLETLELDSIQNVTDFSIFNEYDSMTDFTFNSVNTTTINNLDGMADLDTLTIESIDSVTAITNSFNVMESYLLTIGFIDNFTNLTTITTSFDEYGRGGTNVDVRLDGSINVIDSFHNAETLQLFTGAEIAPNIDVLSFNNITFLFLDSPEYTSYSFLSDLPNVTSIGIDDLQVNITDLNDTDVTSLVVNQMDPSVNLFTYTISPTATLDVTSTNTTTVTINANNNDFQFNSQNIDYNLNTNTTTLTLSGRTNDVIITDTTVTDLDLVSYNTNNMILTTTNLDTITSNAVSGANAQVVDITTTKNIVNFDLRSTSLIINNTSLNNVTVDNPIAVLSLDTGVSSLVTNVDVSELSLQYDTLQDVTISGSVTTLTLDSNLLDTVTLGTTNVSSLTVTSLENTIDVTGTNISNTTINANNILNGTFTVPGSTLQIDTTNNTDIDLNVSASTVDFNGSTITGITFNPLSSATSLDLTSTLDLNTVDIGNDSFGTVDIYTNQTTLSVTGLGTNDVLIDAPAANNVTINDSLSNYEVRTTVVTLNTDLDLNSIELIDSTNLDTFNMVGTSSITQDITFTNTPALETVDVSIASLGSVVASTLNNELYIDGVNIGTATLSGNNLVLVDINVGTGNMTLSGVNTANLNATVQANQAVLNINPGILQLGNTSVVTQIDVNDASLDTVLFGSADVSILNINNSATALEVYATNTDTITVDSAVNNLLLSVPLAATASVDTTSTTGLLLETTTSDITVDANTSVNLTSSTLTDATLNISGNTATFNVTKPALTFNIGGNIGSATFNTNNLNALTFDPSTIITTMQLQGTNVTNLDLSNVTINTLDITSTVASFSVNSASLNNLIIDDDNLTSLNAITPNASLDLTTLGASFDLDGAITSLDVWGNNITTFDFTGATLSDVATFNTNAGATLLDINGTVSELFINDITVTEIDFVGLNVPIVTLVTNALETINTQSAVDFLVVNSFVNNVTITTAATDITFNGNSTDQLNLNASATNVTLNTNVEELVVTAPTTNLSVSALNLETVTGSLNTLNVDNQTTSTTFTINLDASDVQINNSSIQTLIFDGVRTIGNIDVTGNITQFFTNNVAITTATLNSNALTLSVDTLAQTMTLGSSFNGTLTMNVRSSLQTYNTSATHITLNTTNNSSTTVNSLSALPVTVVINNLDTVTFSALNAGVDISGTLTELTVDNPVMTSAVIDVTVTDLTVSSDSLLTATITGTMSNLTVDGTSFNNANFTGLTVNTHLRMLNTQYDDVDFMNAGLIASVDELTVTFINTSKIGSVVDTLRDSNITFNSNMTLVSVYNYYYNEQHTSLTIQEANDNVRYDAYFDTEVGEALNVFSVNTYFDHVDAEDVVPDLQVQVETQTYSTLDQFMESYAISLGFTDEADMLDDPAYDQDDINAIRASMQTTLDNLDLIIDTFAITQQVASDIDAESVQYGETQRDAIGFIIG